MGIDTLGKIYKDGEIIVKQGEELESMYVIQEGQVEVVREKGEKTLRLALLNTGDFFGEVPFFERRFDSGIVRANVQAIGNVRVLTVDKKTILRRLHQDPSLSIRILQVMSRRIRQIEDEWAKLIIGD